MHPLLIMCSGLQVAHSVYLSLQGLFSGGPVHSVTTFSGKLVNVGFGFFMLITLASFTGKHA